MPHRPPWPERRIRAGRWLLAGGMTAALIAMPVASQHDAFGVIWQTALARGPGGGPGDGPRGGPGSGHGRAGDAPAACRLPPQETVRPIERSWHPGRLTGPAFRSHAERARNMVQPARRLGHGAHVGALQANFGTPYATGAAGLEADLADARAELEANPEDSEAAGARSDRS